MLIYNTLSRKKENLDALLNGKKEIRMFVCGPTVYDYIHIGNGRTFVSFDIIVRYLRSIGYKVNYIQNITDIDDKIIRKSQERKVSARQVAKEYTKAYLDDIKKVGIRSVNRYAPATKYIKQIITQVKTLINKGYAYKIDDDGVYFDISKFSGYGKLSGRTATQAEDSVSRIDESVNKRNRGDFALWKFSKPGEPVWKTELGDGRPGWHIEDTAITEYHFGPQYDIHGGAVDLIFPHHEAERAQQESASGLSPFVKIWMHSGFLNIDSAKMSKSAGNFTTMREFLKQYSANAFRIMVAGHHYRSPLAFSEETVTQSENTLGNLAQFLAKLKIVGGDSSFEISQYEKLFLEKMADDFNTPEALAVIFGLINDVNPKIWELSKKSAASIAKWVEEKLNLFGVGLKMPKIPFKIRRLVKKRELSRSSKQFTQSDALRQEIEQLGYIVEDTPIGPFLWPKNLNSNSRLKT